MEAVYYRSVRVLAGVVLVVALAGAGCSHETYLKEPKQQVEREQTAADAANASTTTTVGDDEDEILLPPTTATTAPGGGSVRKK